MLYKVYTINPKRTLQVPHTAVSQTGRGNTCGARLTLLHREDSLTTAHSHACHTARHTQARHTATHGMSKDISRGRDAQEKQSLMQSMNGVRRVSALLP